MGLTAGLWEAWTRLLKNTHSFAYSRTQGREGRLKPTHTKSLAGLPQLPWHAHTPARAWQPLQALKGGPLTLGSELSEETRMLTKPETSPRRGTRVQSRAVREPRRPALPGSQPWVLWGRGWFPGCLWPVTLVLPGGVHIAQLRWIPGRKILGGEYDMWTGISF